MTDNAALHSSWAERISREQNQRDTWRAKHGDFYATSSATRVVGGQTTTLLAQAVDRLQPAADTAADRLPPKEAPSPRVFPAHTSAVARTLAQVYHPRSSSLAYPVKQPSASNLRTQEAVYTCKRTTSLDFAMQR